MSKLILGTVQFGKNYGINNELGKPAKDEIFSILREAYKSGIQILDTAESYGDAHKIISEFHKISNIRFKIITKYSPEITEYPDDLIDRINFHCSNFNINYLECYMFHSLNDFINYVKEKRNTLKELKRLGIIKKIGVSIYENNELEILFNYSEVDLIQLPFNLLDNESKRKEVIVKARKRGIEIHTRSVFLQGLFFKDLAKLSGNLLDLKYYLNFLKEYVKNSSFSMAAFALNYPLNKVSIAILLIGVDSLKQLKNNINYIEKMNFRSIYKDIDLMNVNTDKLLNPSNWKL
jgi:aryl-alcohol dehydrogenase-like predicted oxidoreductase